MMSTRKRVPACEDCQNSYNPEHTPRPPLFRRCTYEAASQHKRWPHATRKCTGYAKIGEKYKPTPEPEKERAIPLVPEDHAFLISRVAGPERTVYCLLVSPPTGDSGDRRIVRTIQNTGRHSPDGFEYGYHGSGPADLAYSILAEVIGAEWAERLYQQFKREHIADKTQSFGFPVGWIVEWFEAQTKHDWTEPRKRKGRDAGTVTPTRCSKCGAYKRPDGKDKPCTGRWQVAKEGR